jgi:TonB-linked SusC/RagA family outer membrane protein
MRMTIQKFTLYTVVFLLLSCGTIASAQITASLVNHATDSGPAQTFKSLKDFLSTLEKTFNVYFTFESSVVRDKGIIENVVIFDNLEETLQKALSPRNLKFQKVSANYYTIYKDSSASVEGQQDEAVTLDSIQIGLDTETLSDEYSASVQVTGVITDEAGEEMPGVNVIEKGTTNGTVTDNTGKYVITVEGESSVLVMSFVGYSSKEEIVGKRTEVNVQLAPDIQTLSEVVVVGYSTQEKKNITAAVNTINTKQLENRPVTNMYQALQGLAPNLIIQQNTAEPGSIQNLNIRGVSSFSTDNTPLIIIDGINVGALGLNYLNPNDVETITVLKDAASSAIYGSQAANGVIYITTKNGKKDEKMSIQYNGMFGWQSPTTTPKAVEGWEYMTLKNEALNNSGLSVQFTPQQIQDQRSKGSYPWAYDKMVNNVVPQQNQSLSITGGSKNTSYLLSVGYLNQQSMFNGSYIPKAQHLYYKRYNFRTNISTQVNKYLKADVNLAYTNGTNRNHPFSTGILVRDAMRTPRIYPIKDDDGNFVVPPSTSNSVFAQLSQGGFKITQSNNLLGVLNLTITPIENLRVNVNTSANYSFYNEESQVRAFEYAAQYKATSAPPKYNEQRKSSWSDLAKTFFSTIEYEKTFSKHAAKVLVGYRSDYTSAFNYVYTYRRDGTILDDRYMIGGDVNRDNDGKISDDNINTYNQITNPELRTVNSAFGRVNYSYSDKYLGEFTWRYDGSSALAPGNRWFFFPGVSVGWRVTDENFLQTVKDKIGDVKLRYSLGKVGNQGIPPFQYLSRVSFSQSVYGFNNTAAQGAYFSTVNPELHWEISTMANYGVDFNVLQGKVSASFDYFSKDTDGILYVPNVPGTLGTGAPWQNFAEVRTVGWEFSVYWKPITGEIKHSVGFNVADNTNKVLRLGQPQIGGSDFAYIIKEGFPISSYYLYKSDGLYQNLSDIENAPTVPFADNQTVNPGDIRYVDKNIDGIIDPSDRYILGNPFPRYTFGVNYNASWKNFDFQMLWQGVGKRQQYLRGDIVEAFHNNEEHAFVQHKDRWTPTNPDASYPRLTASTSSNTNNTAYSDYWLFDTKYLRLKNLQVGYSIPQSLISKVGVQHLRIYFSAQNLLTFAPQRFKALGVDPEFTTFNSQLQSTNYDPVAGRNYPNAKIFAFGIDVKL